MTGGELVAWMEEGGWSIAGLAQASTISERTLKRWRASDRPIPAVWERAIRALRTPPAKRRIKQRSRWAEHAEAS